MLLIALAISTLGGIAAATSGPADRPFEVVMRALGVTGPLLGLLHLVWMAAFVLAAMFTAYLLAYATLLAVRQWRWGGLRTR